jgi:hypothetical protein
MSDQDEDTCSVFRSSVDPAVWMCNVPLTDVADGLQAARSLRKIKSYVEKTAARWLGYTDGVWTKDSDEYWNYQPAGDE